MYCALGSSTWWPDKRMTQSYLATVRHSSICSLQVIDNMNYPMQLALPLAELPCLKAPLSSVSPSSVFCRVLYSTSSPPPPPSELGRVLFQHIISLPLSFVSSAFFLPVPTVLCVFKALHQFIGTGSVYFSISLVYYPVRLAVISRVGLAIISPVGLTMCCCLYISFMSLGSPMSQIGTPIQRTQKGPCSE